MGTSFVVEYVVLNQFFITLKLCVRVQLQNHYGEQQIRSLRIPLLADVHGNPQSRTFVEGHNTVSKVSIF